MRRLNRKGNAGYKLLLLSLPTLLSLIMLTLYLYPRWPKTRASFREKIAAVFSRAVREAIQNELKSQNVQEAQPSVAGEKKPESEPISAAPEEDVNIIAKGTTKGLIFYTDKIGGCEIMVDSSPSGAEVTLNSSIVGRTPIELRGQCGSSFNIKLQKPHYVTRERAITYSKERSVSLRLHAIAEAHIKENTSDRDPADEF